MSNLHDAAQKVEIPPEIREALRNIALEAFSNIPSLDDANLFLNWLFKKFVAVLRTENWQPALADLRQKAERRLIDLINDRVDGVEFGEEVVRLMVERGVVA
jgi:hypothetical protein